MLPRAITYPHGQPQSGHRVWHLVPLLLVLLLPPLLAFLPLRQLVALVTLIGGAIVLLQRPWLAWVGLGIVLPVSSGIRLGVASLTDLFLAGALSLWFLDGARQRRLQPVLSWPAVAFLVFAAILYLSLLQATDLGEATAEVLKWVQFALVLLVAPAMLPKQRVHWLVVGLILGGIFQAILGIYQFIFRIGPEWFMILDRFMRASGSFNQPNPYAGYLGLTLPVAVSLALWWLRHLYANPLTVRRGQLIRLPHLVPTLFYAVSATLIAIGLLASWSRGGWLGAFGALSLVFALRNRAAAALGIILLLPATLLFGTLDTSWIPQPLTERFQDVPAYLGLTDVMNQPLTTENFAIVERLAHWIAAIRMWEQAPWLGVGPGNYATIYPEVRLPLWEEPLGHAHNIYLNMLAEGGVIGLLAYLLLWLGLIRWLWQRYQLVQAKEDWTAPLILGIIGVVAHLSIHSFFDNLFVQGIYLHIALWLASVQTLTLSQRCQDSSRAGERWYHGKGKKPSLWVPWIRKVRP